MIFSINDHIDLIKRGIKTQTRRPKDRYTTFKSYAIQPKRTAKGIPEGRIVILKKWEETFNETGGIISERDAKAEGGYSPELFKNLYETMYPNWQTRWVYKFQYVPNYCTLCKGSFEHEGKTPIYPYPLKHYLCYPCFIKSMDAGLGRLNKVLRGEKLKESDFSQQKRTDP